MIALDRYIRGTLYSFFSCSLICTMMDERTERYDNLFCCILYLFHDEVLYKKA